MSLALLTQRARGDVLGDARGEAWPEKSTLNTVISLLEAKVPSCCVIVKSLEYAKAELTRNDRHPFMTGRMMIGAVEYAINNPKVVQLASQPAIGWSRQATQAVH